MPLRLVCATLALSVLFGCHRDDHGSSDASVQPDGALPSVDLGGDAANADLGGFGFPGAPSGAGTGTTYYVSPSGSDANDGRSPSTAWQTIDKVNGASFAAGDSVLFEGGQSFTGCLTLAPDHVASTPTAAFTVGAYGSGKFTLTANCTGDTAAAIDVGGVSGVIVQDAILVGNGGGAVYGVWLHNPGSQTASGMVVQRCDVSGFYVASGQAFSGEIFITGIPGALDGIGILDNDLHGGSGPASPDDNGVAGYGNGINISHVLYEGNVIHDIGGKPNGANGCEGNGIVANGVSDAVAQHNITHDLGGNVNTCGGNTGFMAYNATRVTFQLNEAYNSRPLSYTSGCDWDGFDLDGSVTDSVMQYNYSHDNFGAGFLFFGAGTWGPNTARYNVSEHDGLGGTTGGGGLTISSGPAPMVVNVYGNTIYDNAPDGTQTPALVFINGVPTGGVIANNIFAATAHSFSQSWLVWSNGQNPSAITFINNDYAGTNPVFEWNGTRYTSIADWQAASSEDPMARGDDPQLMSPGTAGTCNGWSTTCATAYQLKSGSPMIGAGLDLTQAPYSIDVGPSNFWGMTIPGSSGYDIGAD